MKQKTLEDLWSLCKIKDRKAQAEFYNRLSKKMFALSLRYTGSVADAEDILQLGFIKVFTKSDSFQGLGSLEGWVRKIVVYTAIEFLRKNKVDFTNLDTVYEKDSGLLPHSHTDHNDLMSLVQSLPIGYRTVFNMYAIEGYSHKEIADILAISEGSSKSQLSRARKSLQNMIAKSEIQKI